MYQNETLYLLILNERGQCIENYRSSDDKSLHNKAFYSQLPRDQTDDRFLIIELRVSGGGEVCLLHTSPLSSLVLLTLRLLLTTPPRLLTSLSLSTSIQTLARH